MTMPPQGEQHQIIQINPFVTDRRSKYAVTAFAMRSPEEFEAGMKALLKDKKFRTADHNIAAYRIAGGGGIAEFKHDGYRSPSKETGAGIMILEIMRQRDVRDWCLVVTRWYGGVHLGADRFKHVRDAAVAIIDLITAGKPGPAQKRT